MSNFKITVKELREDLAKLPDDTEVLMTWSYSDPDEGYFTRTVEPLWAYCSTTKRLYFAEHEGHVYDAEPNADFDRDRILNLPDKPQKPFYGED